MVEETHRSIISWEVQAGEATEGLQRILLGLQEIRDAAQSTASAFDSVIQKVGEVGYIRVLGIDELQKGITGVRTAIQGLRVDMTSGAAGITVVGEASQQTSSYIGELETRLANLRARAQQLEGTMASLKETNLAPLFRETSEASTHVARDYTLVVGALDQLDTRTLKAMTSLQAMMGTGRELSIKFSTAQQSLVGYWESVEKGKASVTTTADAMRYLAGEVLAYSIGTGMANEKTKQLRGTIESYAQNLLELRRINAEVSATETVAGEARAAHEQRLKSEAGAVSEVTKALQELPQSLKETIEEIRGLGQEESKLDTASIQVTASVTAEAKALQELIERAESAQSALQRLTSAQREQVGTGGVGQVSEQQRLYLKGIHEHGQALGERIRQAQGAQDAQRALTVATEDAIAPVKTVTTGIKEQSKAQQEQVGFLRSLGRQFQVHLRWMLRYIILWKGMRLVSNIARSWFETNMELHYSLALLRATLDEGAQSLQQYETALFSASRLAMALPSQMAPAALMVGRLFDPARAEAMMGMAGQLATLAGVDPADTMRLLIVLQRQLGLSSDELRGVLDALAGSLRHTHLSYEDMLPLLKRAGEYTQAYNMTIEETIGLQAGIASATGASAAELDAMMRRFLQMYELGSKSNQMLNAMGISIVTVGKQGQLIHRPLIDVLRDLARVIGTDEQALQTWSDTLFRTGSVGRIMFQTMMRGFSDVDVSVQDAKDSVDEFDKHFESAADSLKLATADLKEAWQELLLVWTVDKGFLQNLHNMAEYMRLVAENTREAVKAQEELTAGQRVAQQFFARTGPGGVGMPPWLALMFGIHELQQLGLEQPTEMGSARRRGQRPPPAWAPTEYQQWEQPTAAMGPAAPSIEALSLEVATIELPEGLDFARLIAEMERVEQDWIGRYESTSGLIYEITQGQIDAAKQQVLVWDTATREFRLLNAHMPSLQRAISNLTQAMEMAAMVPAFKPYEWPVSPEEIQRRIYRKEAELAGMGIREEPRPYVVRGPEGEWEKIWAGATAMGEAWREFAEMFRTTTPAFQQVQWDVTEQLDVMRGRVVELEGVLSSQGVTLDRNKMFLMGFGDAIVTLTGDTRAMSIAVQEASERMQAIQPSLGQVGFAPGPYISHLVALTNLLQTQAQARGFQVTPGPQYLMGPGMQWSELFFADPTFMQLARSMLELTESVDANTEVQKRQMEGMWNIPEGATAWVPITSMFYRYRETDRAGRRGGESIETWRSALEFMTSGEFAHYSTQGRAGMATETEMAMLEIAQAQLDLRVADEIAIQAAGDFDVRSMDSMEALHLGSMSARSIDYAILTVQTADVTIHTHDGGGGGGVTAPPTGGGGGGGGGDIEWWDPDTGEWIGPSSQRGQGSSMGMTIPVTLMLDDEVLTQAVVGRVIRLAGGRYRA